MRKRLLTLLLGFLCIGQILAQTTYKEDKTICEGGSHTFTASNGDSYQWQKNGVDIPGATNITYTATEAGEYSCKITTSGSSISTGNLLKYGGFNFAPNDLPASKRIDDVINDPLLGYSYSMYYELFDFDRNGNCNSGNYTTTPNPNLIKPTYFTATTPPEGTHMLAVDGQTGTDKFTVFHVRDLKLKAGQEYEFSCLVANIDDEYHTMNHGTGSLAKLRFLVEYEGSGGWKPLIPEDGDPDGYLQVSTVLGDWISFKATFTAPSTLNNNYCHIKIENTTNSATVAGNDFAIDDIYFGANRTTGDSNTTENFKLSIDTKPNVTMPTIPEQCPGATVEIKPTVSNVGSSVQYSWSGAQTAHTKDITATAQATVGGENNYTFTVTNGVCDPVTKYISVITKSCSSTLEKLYATCIGETCNLSQITTTGTGVWTDADGNSLSSRSIMILDNTEKVYTCTVSTTDANGDPITITETHTIKPYNCEEQYTPCETSQHVLSAKHEGRYEWNTGETSKTIVITAGNINDIDEYTCKVTFPSTPNETSIVETHYVRPQMCHIPETKEICKDNNLSLSPKATGDEYIWTLNGAAISNPQTADGSIVINHNTVTPQGSPHKYVCKTYKKANTEGAPNIANNLIENGDFEDASSSASNQYNGFGSNYQFHELNGTFEPKTSATIGYYRLTETGLNGTTHADATNGGHYFLECDGDSNEGSIAYAAPINTPIVKGKEYQFAYSAVTTSTVNFAEITFELVLKNEQGEVIKTEPLVSKQLIDNSTWKQFGVGEYWTADDDYAQAEVRLTNATTTYGGNDFGLDNIMFQPVYRTTSTIDELIMTTEYDIIVTDCTEETERDDEFLIGSTITLKSEIEGGDTYLWYHHNNDPVLDASGNHIGGTSIEIVLMDPANDANINNYYCVVTMPAGVTPSQITEFITLNIFEPTSFNPCQFDEVTLTPTLTGNNENWYRLLTFNDLTQKEVLTGVVGSNNNVDCQDLVGFLNFETGLNQISLVRTITDENGTARDEQWNLTIDQCQETKAPVVKAICQGESYTWNNTSYTATTEKTNVYREKRENRYWEITESLNLTVNPNPSFQVEVDGRTANIITQSNFDFITLDNQSTLTDTKYTWLSIGDHTITMTDNNGCSSTQAFSIVAEPIAPEVFFTPNDDGNNDTWDIDNLEYYPDAIIQIYDRYSRLLSSIKGIDFAGWDGYYNGHIMPMDDYWYVILIPDNNTKVSGHFILKR